jgi:murein DD-endopeptidase MepM/ murein hydrolase activator NlpD
LPGQVWFTPEVIIQDGLDFVLDLIWFWETFKKAVPVFAFRVAALSVLFFLVIGFRHNTTLSAANIPERATKPVNSIQTLQIKSKVKASKRQVFAWPVPKTYISSYFSTYHWGVDIPSAYGRGVKPLSSGKVTYAGWDGGFGRAVHIQHQKGYVTKYAHLSRINVRDGQKVGLRTTIGTIGMTGVATGPHLHFEVYKKGVAINPLSLLP